MSEEPRVTDNVVSLFDDGDSEVAEEVKVGRTLLSPPPASATVSAIDLSDRPKVLMAIGAGGTGKTTLLRWFTEQLLARNSKARLAAIDPERRELKDYFIGVAEPPGYDPDTVLKWLRDFLAHLMETKESALIDLGGGDTSLGRLVTEVPDIVAVMEEAGVSPVAIYPLSPRLTDLSALATLEEAGFQPRATALVLNEGRMATANRKQWFGPHQNHSVYKAAIARGAVEIWMPALAVWKKVEDRQFRFTHARDGFVPEGRTALPLGLLDRSSVRNWLARMDTAFAPISSWVP